MFPSGPLTWTSGRPGAPAWPQVRILNQVFSPTIAFRLAQARVVQEPRWRTIAQESQEEIDMKAALRVGGACSLNLFVVGSAVSFSGAILNGWSTVRRAPVPPPTFGPALPTDTGSGQFATDLGFRPQLDGVVIQEFTLPVGPRSRNGGKTAVHEAGHWLELYHTFQGGCPPWDCPVGSRSCGDEFDLDPVFNMMGYTACRREFTPGQRERVASSASFYRGCPQHDGSGPIGGLVPGYSSESSSSWGISLPPQDPLALAAGLPAAPLRAAGPPPAASRTSTPTSTPTGTPSATSAPPAPSPAATGTPTSTETATPPEPPSPSPSPTPSEAAVPVSPLETAAASAPPSGPYRAPALPAADAAAGSLSCAGSANGIRYCPRGFFCCLPSSFCCREGDVCDPTRGCRSAGS
eukprot:tig00000189_g14340.t1